MRICHVLAVSLGLVSFLTAQRGSYTTFGNGCSGTSTNRPVLSCTDTPTIGRSYSVHLSGAVGFLPVFLSLGASKSQWGPLPLPLDLGPFGAPGCTLLTSLEVFATTVTTAAGTAVVVLTVPNDRSFVGAALHNQWWVVGPGANKLGMVFSNAGTAVVGQ